MKIVKGKIPKVPSHFSDDIQNLLAKTLATDPEKRLNINQILKIPIVS